MTPLPIPDLSRPIRSRAITAENPQGDPGAGGTASSHLGPSRKGRPCVTIQPGETATIAQIEGPGEIRHIWFTCPDLTDAVGYVLRDLVLRMYWDDDENPAVETPLGDFFCNGFGARCLVNSLPIVVAPTGGMNCYFSMPFCRNARITVTNEHPGPIEGFFYQIDYVLTEVDPGTPHFFAQWRRQRLTAPGIDYIVLDGVEGRGAYVGTYLAIAALERHWWGEGEMKFYIDSDTDHPTICGTGTEDYVGGAWAFQDRMDPGGDVEVLTYSTPFLGYPHHSTRDRGRMDPYAKDIAPEHGMYRWHLPDPIHFEASLKVTLQQIGQVGTGYFERSDDVASVAYWYQAGRHRPFPDLPDREARRPR
ncbi:MAG: DUF2961 domain-containing protein [Actinomyces sp.]|nr:glycoside hydrolase family 172 protein [Actinomyces sp.]MCI1642272.1 DUF2961 domain-containing protein [Actinomyces sp.]MCI1662796.1 DUF2961 domain-containing protein [Actinomyces sp.]MCI1691399.1 DUF2961 domain-containing protein [Actinomyces sp.]MCI1788131.1 DUF2961 domain-containing protein [Actinomyces sp.]MCI1830278.1 DUF2961 domain-containing protein [Actinomyces sp.]